MTLEPNSYVLPTTEVGCLIIYSGVRERACTGSQDLITSTSSQTIFSGITLKIRHGGKIHTLEIGKGYKSELLPSPGKPVYQHTTV